MNYNLYIKNMKKFHSLIVSSVSIFLIAIVITASFFFANRTPVALGQGTNQVLDGCGWSETIGWVCFDKTQSYDVNVDASGNMNGYGWSENIGWVNSADSPYLVFRLEGALQRQMLNWWERQ